MLATPDTWGLSLPYTVWRYGLERSTSHCNAPNPTQSFKYRQRLRTLSQDVKDRIMGTLDLDPLNIMFWNHTSLGTTLWLLFLLLHLLQELWLWRWPQMLPWWVTWSLHVPRRTEVTSDLAYESITHALRGHRASPPRAGRLLTRTQSALQNALGSGHRKETRRSELSTSSSASACGGASEKYPSPRPGCPAPHKRTRSAGHVQGLAPRPAPGCPPNTPTPAHGAARADGTGAGGTCEAGEAGNAVGDRQLLEVGG